MNLWSVAHMYVSQRGALGRVLPHPFAHLRALEAPRPRDVGVSGVGLAGGHTVTDIDTQTQT